MSKMSKEEELLLWAQSASLSGDKDGEAEAIARLNEHREAQRNPILRKLIEMQHDIQVIDIHLVSGLSLSTVDIAKISLLGLILWRVW